MTLFFCRDLIIENVFSYQLAKLKDNNIGFQYESALWDRNHVVLKGIRFHDDDYEIEVDNVRLSFLFCFSLSPLHVDVQFNQPKILCHSTKVHRLKGEYFQETNLFLLGALSLNIEIEKGSFLLDPSHDKPFMFELLKERREEAKWHFNIYKEQENLQGTFCSLNKGYELQADLTNISLSYLLELSSFIDPSLHFIEAKKGHVSGSFHALLNGSAGWVFKHLDLEAKDSTFVIQNQVDFYAKNLNVQYKKEKEVLLKLEKGALHSDTHISPYSLKDVEAFFLFDDKQTATGFVKGDLSFENKLFPFLIDHQMMEKSFVEGGDVSYCYIQWTQYSSSELVLNIKKLDVVYLNFLCALFKNQFSPSIDFTVEKGEVSSQLRLIWDKKNPLRCAVESFVLRDFNLQLANAHLRMPHIEGTAFLEQNKWERLKIQSDEAEFIWETDNQTYALTNLSLMIEHSSQEEKESILRGHFKEIPFSLKGQKAKNGFIFHLESSTSCKELLSSIFDVRIGCPEKDCQLKASIFQSFDGKGSLEFTLEAGDQIFKSANRWDGIDLAQKRLTRLEGGFHLSSSSFTGYDFLLSPSEDKTSLSGALSIKGRYNETILNLETEVKDLVLRQGRHLLHLDTHSLKGHGAYHFEKKELTYQTNLANGRYEDLGTGLILDDISTKITWQKGSLFLDNFKAHLAGLSLKARASCGLPKKERGELIFKEIALSGPVDGIHDFLVKQGCNLKKMIPSKGRIDLNSGSSFVSIGWSIGGFRYDFMVQGGLKDLEGEWCESIFYEKGKVSFELDSFKNRVTVKDAEACIRLKNDRYELKVVNASFPIQVKDNEICHVTCFLEEQGKEVARFEGKAVKKQDDWSLLCDQKKTFLLASPLFIKECLINKDGLKACQLSPQLLLPSLPKISHLLYELDLVEKDFLSSIEGGDWQGHLDVDFVYKNGEGVFKGKSQKAFYQKKPISIDIELEKKGDHYSLKKGQWADFSINGEFQNKGTVIEAQSFRLGFHKAIFEGRGAFDILEKNLRGSLHHFSYQSVYLDRPLDIEGTLDSHIQGGWHKNKEEWILDIALKGVFDCSSIQSRWAQTEFMRISLTSHQTLFIEGVDMREKEDKWKLSLSQFVYNPSSQEGSYEGLTLKISHENHKLFSLLPWPILSRISSDEQMQFSSKGRCVDCKWNHDMKIGPHRIDIGDVPCFLEDTHLGWNGEDFLYTSRLRVGNKVVLLSSKINTQNERLGIIKIQYPQLDNPLKCLFKLKEDHSLDIHQIDGEIPGAHVSFKKGKEGWLKGLIEIDGVNFADAFPFSLAQKMRDLKINSRLRVDGALKLAYGDLANSTFEGTLTGQDATLQGIVLSSLKMDLYWRQKSLHLENLVVKDEAFKAHFPYIHFYPIKEEWFFSIPKIAISHFHPSRLKKQTREHKVDQQNAFIIKHVDLREISGKIKDRHSISGSGSFVFSNHHKKDPRFFDSFLKKLKMWGLDPQILIPIQGQVKIELVGDKIILAEIKEVFSESRHSEFYLAEDKGVSYMDWNGTIVGYFRIKQDVSLKLIEPFILTVKGNIKKPKYGISK
ncbi:MAG: hypothetical protein ACOVOR_04890 [Rhabdochlamydiaceae bacterium]